MADRITDVGLDVHKDGIVVAIAEAGCGARFETIGGSRTHRRLCSGWFANSATRGEAPVLLSSGAVWLRHPTPIVGGCMDQTASAGAGRSRLRPSGASHVLEDIQAVEAACASRSPGDQGGCNNDALAPAGQQSSLNAITARPRLVAKPQCHTVATELAQQTVQHRRRVADPAVLPHLAAQTARRHRDSDALLVTSSPT
jgi:hypothetical protein